MTAIGLAIACVGYLAAAVAVFACVTYLDAVRDTPESTGANFLASLFWPATLGALLVVCALVAPFRAVAERARRLGERHRKGGADA